MAARTITTTTACPTRTTPPLSLTLDGVSGDMSSHSNIQNSLTHSPSSYGAPASPAGLSRHQTTLSTSLTVGTRRITYVGAAAAGPTRPSWAGTTTPTRSVRSHCASSTSLVLNLSRKQIGIGRQPQIRTTRTSSTYAVAPSIPVRPSPVSPTPAPTHARPQPPLGSALVTGTAGQLAARDSSRRSTLPTPSTTSSIMDVSRPISARASSKVARASRSEAGPVTAVDGLDLSQPAVVVEQRPLFLL